jgi:hypothetical protein
MKTGKRECRERNTVDGNKKEPIIIVKMSVTIVHI